jgi:hypothetical protein
VKTLMVGEFPTTLEPSRKNRRAIGRAEARLNRAYDALCAALGGDVCHFSAGAIHRLGHGALLKEYIEAGRAYRQLQRA